MTTFVNFTNINGSVTYINIDHIVCVKVGIDNSSGKWISIQLVDGTKYNLSEEGGISEEKINMLINSITGTYTAFINESNRSIG